MLPNPNMDFTAFDVLPAASLDDLVENIEALQDFSAMDEDTLPLNLLIGSDELFPFNWVVSGIVASGDSYGVNKNYSVTSGVVVLNGKRLTVSAVSAQTVGASKDRYLDLHDNGDGTAVYVTTEVNNNAASPSLTSGNMRVGIIVAGATTIAAVGSINQGDIAAALPIASSVAYSVTDSLGNLICNRNPKPTLIGYRQITSNWSQGSANAGQDYDVTGLAAPVIVPAGQKVRIKFFASQVEGNVLGTQGDGLFLARVAESSTQLNRTITPMIRANVPVSFIPPEAIIVPSAGSHTYKATMGQAVTNNIVLTAGSTRPAYISVEII